MKKLLTTLFLAFGLMTIHAQDTAYKITGTVPSDVKKVYLGVLTQREPIDSATVKDGKFEFSGALRPNEIIYVITSESNYPVFNDGTPVDINTVNNTITGSELNKKLYGYEQQLDKYNQQMNKLYPEYVAAAKDMSDTGKAKAKELEAQLNETWGNKKDATLNIINENKDNLIPAVYIGTVSYMLGYDELKKLLPANAPYYNHPAMTGIKRQLAALEKRRPGMQFTDLTMNDTEGKARKLSEWCGKGNYVLVDFWASWCGPCRQEMPNVVENYKKYHEKGFEVVGVSFDNKADAWKNAIKNLDMPWPNISDLKGWQSAAAPTYGINAIPANVLLDGEGKIVAVDLRGDALGMKLKEIYGF